MEKSAQRDAVEYRHEPSKDFQFGAYVGKEGDELYRWYRTEEQAVDDAENAAAVAGHVVRLLGEFSEVVSRSRRYVPVLK